MTVSNHPDTKEQIDALVEHIAIDVHNADADDYTVKWAKQPGKYRAGLRRDVRDVLASMDRLGIYRPSALSLPPQEAEAEPVDHVGASIVPPHCTGYSFSFDPGVLHVKKDGSGYIAVDENDFVLEDDRCEGEHGPEGSVHWIVRLDASEMIALRDFLNGTRACIAAPSQEADPAVVLTGGEDLLSYYERQIDWSRETFGPALRTKGVIDHIRKELIEIELKPHDLSEWVDVTILAMDGFWRHGGKASDLFPALLAKQQKNMARTWPDWRGMSEDSAIEHDRSKDRSALIGGDAQEGV